MNEFLHRSWHGNKILDWLISLAIITAAALLSKGIYRLFCYLLPKITSRTKTKLDDVIVDRVKVPAMMLVILLGIRFALERLTFSADIGAAIHKGFIIAIILNLTWILIQTVKALLNVYIRRETSQSRQVMTFLEQIITIALGGIGAVVALNNAGFDVGALIAGLGI